MRLGIVVGAAVLAATACTSSPTEGDLRVLNGTYTWVRSTGGIAGQTYTPTSVGYTVKFTFNEGKLSVMRNDSVKATTTFSYDGKVTYEPPVNVFTFDPQMEEHAVRVLQGDTIALADPCCDRYEHVFVRAP